MKKSILAVAVAMAAFLLRAELLYWQVSEDAGKTFDYAQLYYTTASVDSATGGKAVNVGGGYEGVGLTSTPELKADITGIDDISGFYVGFFKSGSSDAFDVSRWLSYSEVATAIERSWDEGKGVQAATSVATFVPEPTSGLLLLLGLAGLAVRRKRQA